MHSIRTKITLLTVIAIVISMTVVTILGVTAIRDVGNESAKQELLLLCETGEKNLDSYFESIEQSVETLSTIVNEDLDSISVLNSQSLQAHTDNLKHVFERTVSKTNGVLTYYYRIDPTVSSDVKGFWFTNLDGNGFEEHAVTDITLYDTQDTSSLVWFTVPKSTGKPIWLPPYITDNLDVRVLSYNVPIYRNDQFIGVVGIEIDYSTVAEQVNNIQLYDNGYAFINDSEGTIVYHPRIDVASMSDDEKPKVPAGLLSSDTFIQYNYDGVEKQAVWLPLSNGMRLNVTVPMSEINASWQQLTTRIIIVSIILLAIFILVTMRFAGRITKPLRELTAMAEQVDQGNYDVKLDYQGDDEVGKLTNTFSNLTSHLKTHIEDLINLAFADALTSVRNVGAYNIHAKDLQAELDRGDHAGEFAICVFDCDGLKSINDHYGHDKGNQFLRKASHHICHVFSHSPVYRMGGDEFVAVLLGDDFQRREELVRLFEEGAEQINASAENDWEQIQISMGIAVHDAQGAETVADVLRRADKAMYENKRVRKEAQIAC